MIYLEKPNIVKIVISDQSGNAERFAVGMTLDEVIDVFEASASVAKVVEPKKARKPRRTKAEMVAAPKESIPAETTEEVEKESGSKSIGRKS